MRFLSENRHFHSIVANLVNPLFSIFEELASGTLDLWGAGNFVSIFPPCSHDIFLYLKQPWCITSGTLSSGGPWEQGGEQFISFSARIASATVIWHARPMWLVFLTVVFFCSFFWTYSPCMLVLVYTGLCLAPLDGIKILWVCIFL